MFVWTYFGCLGKYGKPETRIALVELSKLPPGTAFFETQDQCEKRMRKAKRQPQRIRDW